MPRTPHANPAVRLNLPPAPLQMRGGPKGVEIWDVLRRRWLLLTPEEWVRQNFVHYLNASCRVPLSLMANEVAIRLNETSKRCDTVIYTSALRPLAIVEYKAPEVALTREVFEQIVRYNIVLRVRYLIVSNGLCHYCCRVEYEGERPRISFMPEIPLYTDMAQS